MVENLIIIFLLTILKDLFVLSKQQRNHLSSETELHVTLDRNNYIL